MVIQYREFTTCHYFLLFANVVEHTFACKRGPDTGPFSIFDISFFFFFLFLFLTLSESQGK